MSYNGKHPAQVAQELEPILSYVMDRSKLRVLSVDINIGGETVSLAYKDGLGRIEGERPLFSIGCVMDMIFPVIGVSLHHHAGLKLDDPIELYIPEIAPERPTDGSPITIQHLLTRTSGIQDPRTLDEMRTYTPWDVLAPRVREAPRLFSPGTAFNYGGIDRMLLAVALLRFSKSTFAKLGDEIINGPCELDIRPEQYAPVGDDGVRRVVKSSTAHMAKLGACLAAGRLNGGPVAFSDAVRTYLQVEKLPLSRSVKSPPWPHAAASFTLGLFKYSDNLIGFNGFDRGESCSVRYDPQGDLGFSVGLEGPPGVRDYLVAEIAQRLGYNCVQSRAMPCTVGSLNGLAPDDIVGEYMGWANGYRANVKLDEDGVVADLLHRDRRFRQVRIRVEDRNWLVVDNAAMLSSLEFFRDTRTGRVCMASGGVPYAMTANRLNA